MAIASLRLVYVRSVGLVRRATFPFVEIDATRQCNAECATPLMFVNVLMGTLAFIVRKFVAKVDAMNQMDTAIPPLVFVNVHLDTANQIVLKLISRNSRIATDTARPLRLENANVMMDGLDSDVRQSVVLMIALDTECAPMGHVFAKLDLKEIIVGMDLTSPTTNITVIIAARQLAFLDANMYPRLRICTHSTDT